MRRSRPRTWFVRSTPRPRTWTAAEAATSLLAVLVTSGHELLTVIEGDGATAADTRRITEWMAKERPDVAVEVHGGGQPHYPYLFGAE